MFFRIFPLVLLLTLNPSLLFAEESFVTTAPPLQENNSHTPLRLPSIADLSPSLRKTPLIIAQLLQQYHFTKQNLNEKKAAQWIEAYMQTLDYNHQIFLQSDRDEFIKTYSPDLISRTMKCDARPAFEIFERFIQRLDARMTWVQKRFQEPFNFTKDEVFEIDRSKVPWPANMEEADTLWERRLKFDLLQQKLSSKTNKEKPLTTVTKRYERFRRTAQDYDVEDLIQTYLSSLASLYDPHSQYMSPSTLEDFSIGMKLALVGIGAVLSSEDGYCTIREVIPGGPADLDKRLKVNDKIVAVAQNNSAFVDVIDMKLRNIVKLIRGEKNTIVRLKVIPANSTDLAAEKEISIKRDKIQLIAQQASAQILEQKQEDGTTWRIGLIDLPSFYGDVESEEQPGNEGPHSTTKDVALLIEKLKAEHIDGLILDLRRNGGGLLDEAISLTGLFIDKGPVVQIKDRNESVKIRGNETSGMLYGGPLVVLTSRQSASASEILAGALQNYNRAIIIGDKSTHGKGTVQAVVELGKFLQPANNQNVAAGAIKLTIQKFYLPNGHSTQNRGVIPDINLPSLNDYLKIGEADFPHALPWDEISSARFKPTPMGPPNLLEYLRQKTHDRIASSKVFQLLQTDIQLLKERVEKNAISLNESKRLEEKHTEETRKKEWKELDKEVAFNPQKLPRWITKQEPGKPLTIDLSKDSRTQPKENRDEDEEPAVFTSDFYLKETLQIMSDWLSLRKNLASSSNPNI